MSKTTKQASSHKKDVSLALAVDLRTLKLSKPVFVERIYNPQHFTSHFGLENEFVREFGMKAEDWDFSISDQEVYDRLLKCINTPDTLYFYIWNERAEENDFYKISTKQPR